MSILLLVYQNSINAFYFLSKVRTVCFDVMFNPFTEWRHIYVSNNNHLQWYLKATTEMFSQDPDCVFLIFLAEITMIRSWKNVLNLGCFWHGPNDVFNVNQIEPFQIIPRGDTKHRLNVLNNNYLMLSLIGMICHRCRISLYLMLIWFF